MTDSRMRLAVLVASVREGRFGPTVARWFAGEAGRHGRFLVDLVDLAESALPLTMGNDSAPEVRDALGSISPRLAAADAFVVVTPEYNHSFPASVKNVIDWHRAEWQAKPVGFVSYGGLAGGLRAVEQLRPVFAELHAATVRDTVSFHNVWTQFDADGEPLDPGCEVAAKVMLDQLVWWGDALRTARAAHPYRT